MRGRDIYAAAQEPCLEAQESLEAEHEGLAAEGLAAEGCRPLSITGAMRFRRRTLDFAGPSEPSPSIQTMPCVPGDASAVTGQAAERQCNLGPGMVAAAPWDGGLQLPNVVTLPPLLTEAVDPSLSSAIANDSMGTPTALQTAQRTSRLTAMTPASRRHSVSSSGEQGWSGLHHMTDWLTTRWPSCRRIPARHTSRPPETAAHRGGACAQTAGPVRLAV